MFDLGSVMMDCESGGEYERSAALAVWHGNIGSAVFALERGAVFYSSYDTKKCNHSIQYSETLEHVALSIAGYHGGDGQNSGTTVWRRSCAKLLQRPDLLDSIVSSGASYLRHILKFLMTIGIDDSHKEVMADSALSLCDRVAFACRFLSNTELMVFVDKCIEDCQASGNVEGLIVTGVDAHGIQILQGYVDITADVQTAALITSRVILPAEWVTERRTVAEWLQSYRTLLNRWQMWQCRAMFDVERASVLRMVKLRQQPTIGNSSSRNRQPLPRLRSVDSEVQATIPAQLDARCNYCSAPLGLRRQDNQPNQWLSKMKNVLPCCPRCRKPLPRCSICMLTLGAPNPYYELTKDRPRTSTPIVDDLSTLANLPFAEWFSWCLRCKHGGHAHHLVGWFAKHEVCPVSGCSCRCQFDGIRELNRPTTILPPISPPSQSTHINYGIEKDCS
jgi:WD repeat-containing protein mio